MQRIVLALSLAVSAVLVAAPPHPPASTSKLPEFLSPQTAPEDIVYGVFLNILAQGEPDSLRTGARKDLRARHQQITQLDNREFEFLESVAREYTAVAASPAIVGPARPSRMDAAQLDMLRNTRARALVDAVARLRTHFGPEGFLALDRRIRLHVVPRLRIGPNAKAELRVTK